MNLLTSSRLRTARACQRMHRYKYVDGYRPRAEADALRFGTLVHRGLEAWWREAKAASRLGAALAAMAERDREDQEDPDPFDLAKATAMLVGYDARWGAEPYEVLGVEVEFSAPLVNPMTGKPSRLWRIGGKIDAIVRDTRDGRVLVVEHKTASGDVGPGSEYWRRLRMDGQVSIYYEGARSLGHDVAGCLYDVLGKPGQRPLEVNKKRSVAETPAEYGARVAEAILEDPSGYYQRGEVVRLEAEMTDALYDVWQLGKQIHESALAGRFPRNPDACAHWGRTCEYFAVCTGEADITDPTLFTKSSNVFPELSGLAVAAQPKEEAVNGHTERSDAEDPAAETRSIEDDSGQSGEGETEEAAADYALRG